MKFIKVQVSDSDGSDIDHSTVLFDAYVNADHILYVVERDFAKYTGAIQGGSWSIIRLPEFLVTHDGRANRYRVHDKTIQEIIQDLRTP